MSTGLQPDIFPRETFLDLRPREGKIFRTELLTDCATKQPFFADLSLKITNFILLAKRVEIV